MAGPYGRVCRDLFGQSLHIKGMLVLDEEARLTVANSTVEYIDVRENVITSGISEKGGQEGICVIGNLEMKENFALHTDIVSGTVPGQGVSIKNGIEYTKFGFGKVHLTSDLDLLTDGNITPLVFSDVSFESTLTVSQGLVHPNNDTSKTFVAPNSTTLVSPMGCSFGNVVVDAKMQIQANITTAQTNDRLIVTLVKNGVTDSPIMEYIHTIPVNITQSTVQTLSISSHQKIVAGDQLDYYIFADNVSGMLDTHINSGQHKSFASFDIVSLEP